VEQSPWADSHPADQEISSILWNLKVHMSGPLDSIQMTVAHKCYNITIQAFQNLFKSTEKSIAVRNVNMHEELIIN
jgi:hypothetical protein